MLIATTDNIADKNYEVLGLVEGATVQCKHIGNDFLAGLKNLVGGEMTAYTDMMNEARTIAKQRMTEQAQRLGADAIINFRYSSSEITQGAAEVVAYGTAVKYV
ncbi:MAG: heavy metal-binding domain-containing protein [Ruminococcus sp.]|jgi:uncharacterized protein YbjQ (UPF0145 family)|nr:heavy metal-binding domain-containing protein [Ruminococcus sp.]